MTQDKIEALSRAQIAEFLPGALSAAIETHTAFLEQSPPHDPAEYKKYQEACKVALTHIELLTKLAVWVDIKSKNVNKENASFSEDLTRAMREVQTYQNQNKEKNNDTV